MDSLLDELRVQETNYYESLVKSAGVDGAGSASRSSLRAELERARAEQMRLQDAAREQQAQLEQLRSRSAVEISSLEERVLEHERLRRAEEARDALRSKSIGLESARNSERGDVRGLTVVEAADDGELSTRSSSWRPAQAQHLPAAQSGPPQAVTMPPADLLAAVALNASHIARVEQSVDALASQMRAIDEKLARVIELGLLAQTEDRAHKVPPSRSLFRPSEPAEESGSYGGGGSRTTEQRTELREADQARAEADTAKRLSVMSAKYEALKKKFARQTIREAELHGYLLQHGAPSPPMPPRPASERRARPRASDVGDVQRDDAASSVVRPVRAMAAQSTTAPASRVPLAPAPAQKAAAVAKSTASDDRTALLGEKPSQRRHVNVRVPTSGGPMAGKENAHRTSIQRKASGKAPVTPPMLDFMGAAFTASAGGTSTVTVGL